MPSSSEPFTKLTLDGERFSGARLPIDALVELQRYREMLLASAKVVWLGEHPGQEVPAAFALEFDLAIADVEDGSATPLLEKPQSQYDVYYEAGRDALEAGFAAIVANNFSTVGATPEDESSPAFDLILTPQAEPLADLVDNPAFREFGSSLQPDEVIHIPATEAHPQIEVTATTSVASVLPFIEFVEQTRHIDEPDPVKSEKFVSTVAGRLIAINAERTNFTMDTLHFGEITGRYADPEMTSNLKAVLDSSSQAPLVRITGRMSWRDGRLYRILSVDDVELLEIETEPWSRRIIELASLGPNWHPEIDTSPVISFVAIDAAREILRAVVEYPDTAGVYPADDGGVILEWARPDRVLTVEISPSPSFFVFDLDVPSREAHETETEDLDLVKSTVEGALR